MNYRRLGRTNLQVSEVSLGTVELGLDYGIGSGNQPDGGEAERLLARALDLGINFIDTARAYGESEAIIGRALHGRRREYVLASKVLSFEGEGLRGRALRERVMQSVRQSLCALRTETLDILMIHSASAEVIARGEMLTLLEELRHSGDVRFLGASVYGEEAALAAIRTGGFDCLQIAYSLLDRRPERRVFAAARESDVGLVARSVLLKGALTWRYRQLPDGLEPLKLAVERLLSTGGMGIERLPEMAYRFVLAEPAIHTALVGASTVAELAAAVEYARLGPLAAGVAPVWFADDELLNPGNWPVERSES